MIKKDCQKNHTYSKMLVNILETGTPEEFRNGMRNHLENHFVRIFQ